jgi:two-component system chemotaxis response regulator CheY
VRLEKRKEKRTMSARVLIVDDALFMRNMLRNIFIESGFEVVGEAANGNEAVARYEELKPDLVTMDIVMPEKSGIEALKLIVKGDPGARVVICSALGQESLIIEALEAGARDLIVKPFKPAKVVEVAQKVLAAA